MSVESDPAPPSYLGSSSTQKIARTQQWYSNYLIGSGFVTFCPDPDKRVDPTGSGTDWLRMRNTGFKRETLDEIFHVFL